MLHKQKLLVSPSDYEGTATWLRKKNYKFNVSWDSATEMFLFEWSANLSYYERVMEDLADMARTTLDYENRDSLNMGISAIKTLIDMGVIK